VPVLYPNYEVKRWTGWEWLHIYGLLTKDGGHRVMPCRFQHANADGLTLASGFIELDDKTPQEAARLILERLALNESKPKDFYTKSATEALPPPPSRPDYKPPPPRLKKFWATLLTVLTGIGIGIGVWRLTQDNPNKNSHIEIAKTSTRASYPYREASPVLSNFWSCDGDAKDSVGGRNGILHGGVTPTAGKRGQALRFNGSDGYIEIPNAPNPPTFSLTAWVRFDSLSSRSSFPGLQYVFFRKNSRSTNFDAFALAKKSVNGADHFILSANTAGGYYSQVVSATRVQTGIFYFIAGVFDGSWLRLYVNGQDDGSIYHPYPIDYGDRPMFFGSTGEAWDGRFTGLLEKVALYEGALSPDQVQKRFIEAVGK